MATKRPRKLEIVEDSKSPKSKGLSEELDKVVKFFTKQVQSIGAKYGIILDIDISIRETEKK